MSLDEFLVVLPKNRGIPEKITLGWIQTKKKTEISGRIIVIVYEIITEKDL